MKSLQERTKNVLWGVAKKYKFSPTSEWIYDKDRYIKTEAENIADNLDSNGYLTKIYPHS